MQKMKFSVCALFLTFAIASSLADDDDDKRCPNCPNSLNAVDGLISQAQTLSESLLDHLPLGLGNILNELLNLVRSFLTGIRDDLSGGLQSLLRQVGAILSRLSEGGSFGISTPGINIPGIKIPGIQIPGINL